MRIRILLIGVLLFPHYVFAQKASITEKFLDILTYPFSDPNPIPILTEKHNNIYPYYSFDGYSTKGQLQKWKVITLENDFIQVFVLPEAGGKVWGAIEKSTGKEFIYRNEVMKFRNIALRGPWTSGGIEFNFGIIGHSPATATPVDYLTRENADGSVSCFVGNMDLPSRTQWRVEIRLPVDKAYFQTNVLWNNPTPLPQSYYNWMTAAAVVTNDLQFYYPGNRELDHDGTAGSWPVDKEGHDLSWYSHNAFGTDRSSHVVGEYNDFMGGYYHSSDFGFGHWALYDEMPGRKLWLWAQSRSGAIWEDLLTDSDGQYMEFQAGRSFNQYAPAAGIKTPITQLPFAPVLTDRWSEIWFPVKGIGGIKAVSPMGILNTSFKNGQLQLGIHALSKADSRIIVKCGDQIIYSQEKKFSPMEVFTTTVPMDSSVAFEVFVNGMDLQYSSEKRNLIKRPFVNSFQNQASTAASLYQEGMEQKENRHYKAAKENFLQCLQKDPLYVDAMVALGEIYYRSSRNDSALFYIDQALQLDTYHPAANYFAGIIYHTQGDLINALETFGWAARSLEYRSAAYSQMAAIHLQLKEPELSEQYAKRALDFNAYNSEALNILSIIYRIMGNPEMAESITGRILAIDPLNHFAWFERYLLDPSSENFRHFTGTIKNEFPYQTYLELCLEYSRLGCDSDALKVLTKAPSHPLVWIWQAYLENNTALLTRVIGESPAFVFPYRMETVAALTWATRCSNHWKFKYYLGLNYWAMQREDQALKLFMDCGQEPDFAAFYISRAFLEHPTDKVQELADLQTSVRIAPGDWRAYEKIIQHYMSVNDKALALQISGEAFKKFRGNSTIELLYARALLMNGTYAACIKTLEEMHILPFEGSNQGKIVYEQANVLLALDMIKGKKYKEALKPIEKSKAWPENLGSGKPYEPDIRLQNYLEAYCLMKVNHKPEAIILQQSVVDFTIKYYEKPSFNNLLALWILKAKEESDQANSLLEQIRHSAQSAQPMQQWVIDSFIGDSAAGNLIEESLTGNLNLSIIKSLPRLDQ